jgi:hypothetical protein
MHRGIVHDKKLNEEAARAYGSPKDFRRLIEETLQRDQIEAAHLILQAPADACAVFWQNWAINIISQAAERTTNGERNPGHAAPAPDVPLLKDGDLFEEIYGCPTTNAKQLKDARNARRQR